MAKSIPDLDPTLVKAMAIQESNDGVNGKTDILTANNPGDWKKTFKQKEALGMTKGETESPTNSLFYGIRMLGGDGFKGGVSVQYDNKNGTTTTGYKFQGWQSALKAYNGGGVPGYDKYIQSMVKSAVAASAQNY